MAHPNRGLAYAAELAGPLQAQAVLLHVRYDELLSHQEYVSNHSTRRADEERKQALSALAESQPVPAEVEISEDFLSDAVAASVRQHQSQPGGAEPAPGHGHAHRGGDPRGGRHAAPGAPAAAGGARRGAGSGGVAPGWCWPWTATSGFARKRQGD
ncbi:hypothetical protein ACFQT0_21270 [Hymenobacter humi]|uniref:Uncharacterized protein n=1 Tax=Hymenobacter humi TaxID=1411620 RepID=A0ABW2U7Z0_9BACT